MGWLIESVEASLRAEYKSVEQIVPGYFLAKQMATADRKASTPDKAAKGPVARTVLVGVSEREDGFGPGGSQGTARAFTELVAGHKPDQSYLVLASGKGITAEARQQLTDLGVTRQGLIEFLDRFYSTAVTRQRGVYDAVQSFARLNKHLITDRVAHRYQKISIDGLPLGIETSGDLFADLYAQIEGVPAAAKLTLVTGQAGGGKTVLFKALFAALYEKFNDAKARHYGPLCPRPVFFVPDYLKSAESYSFDKLVEAMFETVGAETVSKDYLDWLHVNGNVILMFDGMDEFFARQTDLFDRLHDAMARPGSRAQLIICARDSLLGTNDALIRFLGRVSASCGPQAVDVVKLLRWDAAARQDLASFKLTGRRADHGELLDPDVEQFEQRVVASPTLTELTATPFFCDLLIELFKEEGDQLPADMVDILERVVERFLDREVGKLRGEELTADVRAAYLLGEEDAVLEADPLALLASTQDQATLDLIRERLGIETSINPQVVPMLLEAHARLGRDGVLDLLAAAAHLNRRNPMRPAEGMTESVLASLLDARQTGIAADSERRFRAMLIFKQMALFSQKPGSRSVDFTHEFLADYLAARHSLNVLRLNPSAFGEAVGDLAIERTEIYDMALARGFSDDPELATAIRTATEGRMQDGAAAFISALLPQ